MSKMEKGFMSQEDMARANIMLALLRAFCDSINGMSGAHRHALKLKYNRLVKTANQYIRELDKINALTDGYMAIYDDINDMLYEKRDIPTGAESEMVEDQDQQSGSNEKGKE
jgi:hypothetical protein